jgi:hypothetical protein
MVVYNDRWYVAPAIGLTASWDGLPEPVVLTQFAER